MDDIGNLVYIAVFIIWFLYRTFGKAGKKQSRPLPPFNPSSDGGESVETEASGRTQEKPAPMTFEELLRELTGAPPVTVEKPAEVDYEAEEFDQSQEESRFEVLEPVEELPSPPQFAITSRFKEFELSNARSSKAARAARKMFKSPQGAKQAFIMKEIFDRKY